MTNPVSGSIGGSGAACCCTSWANRLCYTETLPEETLLLFRENNDFVDTDGTYDLYTWNPDAALVTPSLAPIPAYVNGVLSIFAWENGTFNSTYVTFYSMINTAYTTYGSDLKIANYTDPTTPTTTATHTLICNFNQVICFSIAVNPITDILWCVIRRPDNGTREVGTINTATGVITVAYNSAGNTLQIIGFNTAGLLYLWDNAGNTFTLTDPGVTNILAGVWSFAGSEVPLSFMGYAGGTNHGVCTYDGAIFRNRLLNIATGAISDTIVGQQRGVFYLPASAPTITLPFTRTFTVDCDDVLTTSDRNSVTGEVIVLPEGATVEECP